MKHKVGDKVRIKSLDWYNKNGGDNKAVNFGLIWFGTSMKDYCGKIATIMEVGPFFYRLDIDNQWWYWVDKMFDETYNMEQKEVKVKIPEGYEVDKEKSTFEEPINIVFKKKDNEVRNWNDLVGKKVPSGSKVIDTLSNISILAPCWTFDKNRDKNIFIDEKPAKSALAMAQISQLMPYYGGAITDEEWDNEDIHKYVINKYRSNINKDTFYVNYVFLAFHTEEQRDDFLKYNEQLIKDYLMI